MFTDDTGAPIDFDDPLYDNTGVRGAKALIAEAMSDVGSVRTFLNGTSNIFGLDPNFLLLVPGNETTGKFDSYDVLADKLTEVDGAGSPVGPLEIARQAFGDPLDPTTGGGANQAFAQFRANVDQVIGELSELQLDYADQFVELTGYAPDEEPGFDGVNPKIGSLLDTVIRQIDNLDKRNDRLTELTDQLMSDAEDAQRAVTLAQGIEGTITGAESEYLEETGRAWREIHRWAGTAAAAQATFDTIAAVSSLGTEEVIFSVGANAAAIGIAGAANAAVQSAAAVRTSKRQQEIDEAAIALDVKIATAELPLTVQQAIIEMNALHRELLANYLEIIDNTSAQSQALADKHAILREIDRLEKRHAVERNVLATSYYADPIFYVRAERALLEADNAFRTAQRWMFYTCRALEYKWQQRFSR